MSADLVKATHAVDWRARWRAVAVQHQSALTEWATNKRGRAVFCVFQMNSTTKCNILTRINKCLGLVVMRWSNQSGYSTSVRLLLGDRVGGTTSVSNQVPRSLSLAILPWVGAMSTHESWGVNRHHAMQYYLWDVGYGNGDKQRPTGPCGSG